MAKVILYFLCFFAEAVILLQYTTHLFTPKHSLNKRLLMLSSFYFSLFAISLLDMKWLNMALYILVNFIFIATQYNLKPLSAFFHSTILAAVMGMCELAVFSIINHFLPHFLVQMNYWYNTLMFAIFSKITFFAVVYVLIHLFRNQNKSNQQRDSSVMFLIFIPLTAIFVMLTFLGISDNYTLSPVLSWMLSLSVILLLIATLLVFGINQYNQKKNLEFTEMQLMLQKEIYFTDHYKMLLSQNENQNILIHDIKKHLQSIELLNDQEEHDKLRAYIKQLLLSPELKGISRICDHELLNAILSQYARQSNEKNISFNADIRSGTTDFIADNDLTSLFCNLLDNAMEAACNVNNSFIEINTSRKENTPFVIITVINSCLTAPSFTENGHLITRKSNKSKHGFGVKSINKVIKKYHGDMKMYFNPDSSTFHTIITLKQYDQL